MSDTSDQNSMKELIGDVYSASILIVDDMLLMQKMIGQCLSNAGYMNLSYAADGKEAIDAIEKDCPDIVILDLNMPKLSGYDVLRQLRAQPEYADLPVLVQSAAESPQERTEVFNVGGTDFVSKPINQPELLARVQMHIENKLLISNLKSFHKRVRTELDIAKEMQQGILPARELLDTIEEKHNIGLEAFYESSSELGGDLWGMWEIDDENIGVFILDVSGHGVGSALNTFRAHSTMDTLDDLKSKPAEFLTRLNQELAKDFDTGSFATMFYGVLNTETKLLRYAGAGAPNPLLLSKDRSLTRLDSAGVPVGIVKSATYEDQECQMSDGDCLFLYSDVLIEARGETGGFLGDEGLEQLFLHSSMQAEDCSKSVAHLIGEFKKLVPGVLPDDLTAVGIHF